jgi:hypothetical protein
MPANKPSTGRVVTPGEIYLLDQPRLRKSNYPHYVIVLAVIDGEAWVNFCSSEEQQFMPERGDIMIRRSDIEFKSTGFTKDTFLINQEYARVIVAPENLFELKPRAVGYVSGRFKERIEDYFGDKL